MSNSKRRHTRQVQSVTGRDSYVICQGLAYAVIAIELLPQERQEQSNAYDMRLILNCLCDPSLRRHLLDNARAHLTGIGHPASTVSGTVISSPGIAS
jgi:hypothetical protein